MSVDEFISAMDKLDFNQVTADVIKHKQDKKDKELEGWVRKMHTIVPSKLGWCMRRQFFADAGLTSKPDAGLQQIFAHGHLIHDEWAFPVFKYWMENVLRARNVALINEYPYYQEWLKYDPKTKTTDKLYSRGYIDDLFVAMDCGFTTPIPIEIKSIGNRFFKLKEPDLEHLIQLYFYLGVLGADMGHIVYIHKGTLTSKTFEVKSDPKIFDSLIDRGAKLYFHKKHGEIPEAEALKGRENKDYWFSKPFAMEDDTVVKDQCDGCEHIQFCLQQKDVILGGQDG